MQAPEDAGAHIIFVTEPTSIPELIMATRTARRLSQNAFALYMAVPSSAVSLWARGLQRPNPESCAKMADLSGYPVEFVLKLAGHLRSDAEAPPTPNLGRPTVEVIPELGLLIKRFGPEDQRRWVLPAVRLALELREDRAPYDASPPPQEATPPPPTPPEDPQP